MNLSVNLIEESEKRQGGSLSPLFFIRIIAWAIPIIIALIIGHLAICLTLNKSQLERAQAQITDKKDQLVLSAEIMKQQRQYRDLLGQLNGWKALRLDWNKQLEALRLTVPLEVQLTSLDLSQTMMSSNGIPVAVYKLLLTGKTGGLNPESNLTRFRQTVIKDPKLSERLDDVVVPEGAFVEDTSPNAQPSDRLFKLNCTFQPQVYK